MLRNVSLTGMSQRVVEHIRVLLFVYAAACAACGTTSVVHPRGHHSDAERTKLPDCPHLAPEALANATPLTVIDDNEIALHQGLLELMIQYDRADPARATHATFDALRFTALAPSEFALAERYKPQNHARNQSWIDVQVVGADGVPRFAETSEPGDLGTSVMLIARVPLRRDSQVIRVVEEGRTVITLRRPESPPVIEARLIQERPPLVAVRVRAHTGPLAVSFIDAQRAYPVDDAIRPNKTSCWFIVATPLDLHYDPHTSLRVSLLDVFYRWSYQLPTP